MDLFTLQLIGGAALTLLVLWQLAVGLRWIKLGKSQYKIHRWSGIALAVLVVPHLVNGLRVAGVLKF